MLKEGRCEIYAEGAGRSNHGGADGGDSAAWEDLGLTVLHSRCCVLIKKLVGATSHQLIF